MLISCVFWLYFRRAYRSSKGRTFSPQAMWPSDDHECCWQWAFGMRYEKWGRTERVCNHGFFFCHFSSLASFISFFFFIRTFILWIVQFLLWKCFAFFAYVAFADSSIALLPSTLDFRKIYILLIQWYHYHLNTDSLS